MARHWAEAAGCVRCRPSIGSPCGSGCPGGWSGLYPKATFTFVHLIPEDKKNFNNEVLHLTFPCVEIFFHTWKKMFHGWRKRFPWQPETDPATYVDVPEVFITSYKEVIYSRKYRRNCSKDLR